MKPSRKGPVRSRERRSRIYIGKHEQLRKEVVKLVRVRVKAGRSLSVEGR